MRSPFAPKSHIPVIVLLALILMSLTVLAQEEQSETSAPPPEERPALLPTDVQTEPGSAEEIVTVRRKNPSRFSVCTQMNILIPVRVLKEEVYDINDLSKSGLGYGAGLTYHFKDYLAFSFKGMRGGFNFVDNKLDDMQDINIQLDGTDTLNPDSYMKMDTYSFNVVTYLGGFIMPESNFNPFVIVGVMNTDWALYENGRDSEILAYQGKPIEGKSGGIQVGMGTAYRLNSKIALQATWAWTHIRTGDEIKWVGFQSNFNKSFYWTNSHYWNLGLGLSINY